MKKVTIVIGQSPPISDMIGMELALELDDKGSIIDAIALIDSIIARKGNFPIRNQHCLLHMVYNPIENRFYNQVGVTGYLASGGMFNLRDNPKKVLPDGVRIILIPDGICITSWEKSIDYEEFLKVRTEAE